MCCKPPSAPYHWGDCYTENIRQSFDKDGALVGFAPLHYIVGIYTNGCEKFSVLKSFDAVVLRMHSFIPVSMSTMS